MKKRFEEGAPASEGEDEAWKPKPRRTAKAAAVNDAAEGLVEEIGKMSEARTGGARPRSGHQQHESALAP